MTNRCFIRFKLLVDYHAGSATAAQIRYVRRHLQRGCPDCARRLKWLDMMIPALHRAVTEELPVAPADVLERARNIARERHPIGQAQPLLLVCVARLVFDSRQPQFAAGVRDAESGNLQLLYSTDENDVDLWQEKQGTGNWYLIGQVLPKNGDDPIMPTEVVLSASDGRRWASTPATEEFTVRDIPAGAYEMRLRLPDHEIVLPDVVVGA